MQSLVQRIAVIRGRISDTVIGCQITQLNQLVEQCGDVFAGYVQLCDLDRRQHLAHRVHAPAGRVLNDLEDGRAVGCSSVAAANFFTASKRALVLFARSVELDAGVPVPGSVDDERPHVGGAVGLVCRRLLLPQSAGPVFGDVDN